MNNLLGTKLRELRKSKDMKQQDVANSLELGASTISQYENGVTVPDFGVIEKLSKLYEVDSLYLILLIWGDGRVISNLTQLIDPLNDFINEINITLAEESDGKLNPIFISSKEKEHFNMWKTNFGDLYFNWFSTLSTEERLNFLRDVKLLWQLDLFKRSL